MLRYADTSALVRAYVPDEADHAELRALLLEGEDPVVSSELARVELASAAHAAVRSGRLDDPVALLAQFDADCGDEGPLTLIRLRSAAILPRACELVGQHRLCTLDAVHLAVALTDGARLAGDDGYVFVTRDSDQAAAAAAQGLDVR